MSLFVDNPFPDEFAPPPPPRPPADDACASDWPFVAAIAAVLWLHRAKRIAGLMLREPALAFQRGFLAAICLSVAIIEADRHLNGWAEAGASAALLALGGAMLWRARPR